MENNEYPTEDQVMEEHRANMNRMRNVWNIWLAVALLVLSALIYWSRHN